MQEFVCRKNIDHFRMLLHTTLNPAKRHEIERLLASEEAKLAAILVEAALSVRDAGE